jgi:predicted nucleotidyltransferase
MEHPVYERLKDAAPRAFEGTPVFFAYLFGSAATGRHHPASDVDVAVYLDSLRSPQDALDSSLDLANRLSRESRVGHIDLLVLNEAPLTVLGRVIKERKVLYSRDEPARVRFESRTLTEFFDFEISRQAAG